MGRVLLTVSLVLLSAAIVMAGLINRYQYVSITGPAWSGKMATETDIHRIDRWTGTPQIWMCDSVDTGQVANVPRPPAEPFSDGSGGAVETAARHGVYLVALKGWRANHPHVNPETMRVTTPHCNWEVAR
jgi:hypothetical protein